MAGHKKVPKMGVSVEPLNKDLLLGLTSGADGMDPRSRSKTPAIVWLSKRTPGGFRGFPAASLKARGASETRHIEARHPPYGSQAASKPPC